MGVVKTKVGKRESRRVSNPFIWAWRTVSKTSSCDRIPGFVYFMVLSFLRIRLERPVCPGAPA
jgi:hypothetical protein